jgi:hypothetical protein
MESKCKFKSDNEARKSHMIMTLHENTKVQEKLCGGTSAKQ